MMRMNLSDKLTFPPGSPSSTSVSCKFLSTLSFQAIVSTLGNANGIVIEGSNDNVNWNEVTPVVVVGGTGSFRVEDDVISYRWARLTVKFAADPTLSLVASSVIAAGQETDNT